MRIFILSVFILFSCKTNSAQENMELNKFLDHLLDSTYLNVDGSIINNTNSSVELALIFNEPFVTHLEYRKLLLMYIIEKSDFLNKKQNILIHTFLSSEKDKPAQITKYDLNEIKKIKLNFKKHKAFLPIIESLISNMNKEMPYEFDQILKGLNQKKPNKTTDKTFVNALSDFIQECETGQGKAHYSFFQAYSLLSYYKYLYTGDDYPLNKEQLMKRIKSFEKIFEACGETIEYDFETQKTIFKKRNLQSK